MNFAVQALRMLLLGASSNSNEDGMWVWVQAARIQMETPTTGTPPAFSKEELDALFPAVQAAVPK